MSDPTGAVPAEGTPAPEAPAAEPTAEPWAPVLDRMSELASNIDTRFQAVEQRLPQPEPEPEPDPWAAITGGGEEPEQFFDQYGNPVDMGQFQQPQGLDPAALQQAVNAAIQQQNAPLVEQLTEMRNQAALAELGRRVPQLADTPENAETRQQTAQAVYQAVQRYPQHIQETLAHDVDFIETIYKAAEADKLARAQVPASETVPSLEAAGGAVPGGSNTQQNVIQRVHEGAWELPKGLR